MIKRYNIIDIGFLGPPCVCVSGFLHSHWHLRPFQHC